MTTLRTLVDGVLGSSSAVKKVQPTIKTGDQVVFKKRMDRSGPMKREVMVGTVTAMAADGKAILSVPRPGGRMMRATVSTDALSLVSDVYKRSAVQVNPGLRGILNGR